MFWAQKKGDKEDGDWQSNNKVSPACAADIDI
jgi:hypothetical protein